MFRRIAMTAMLMIIAICSSISLHPYQTADASAVLKIGSVNGDVWDAQYRLKALGYYDGPLDGVYGTITANATRKFQRDYGLKADGIIGEATWTALRKYSLNMYEVDVLAKIIHGEARGEPYIGQVAVGAVVLNRIRSPLFPDTIYDVVFQAGAFTAVADGQYWLKPGATAYRAALDAVRGRDPSGGALYYYNPDTATSKWIRSRPQTTRIGNHIFAK